MVGSCDNGGGGYCVGATDVAGIFACESVTASFSIFAPFEIPQVTFESQLVNFRVCGSPRQKFVARTYNLPDALG